MPPALPDFVTVPAESAQAALVAAGLVARMGGAVAAGAVPLGPALSLRIRAAMVLALAVVAFPAARTAEIAAGSPAVAGPAVFMVLGEAAVGLMIGTAVALVVGSTAWAGGILGSVSGLAWSDDFDPAAAGGSAGMERLAWWVGLGGFCAAGGLLTLVAGLVDGVRTVPVGAAWSPDGGLTAVLVGGPAVALRLAVGLAAPALVAVLAFHIAAAICMRTVAFAPGAGLLQAVASLVLLAAVSAGAGAWAAGFGSLVQEPVAAFTGAR